MQSENFKSGYFLDKAEVEVIVKSYVSEFFFVDSNNIALESRFEEDICADPVVLADCIDALEEEIGDRAIGFRIDEQERTEIESVGNLVEAISAHVVKLNNRIK